MFWKPWYCCVHVLNVSFSPCGSDRTRHPALPVRLVGHPLPAAQAGGGRTFTPASCRPVLPRVCGLQLSVVSLFYCPSVRKHSGPPFYSVHFFFFFLNTTWPWEGAGRVAVPWNKAIVNLTKMWINSSWVQASVNFPLFLSDWVHDDILLLCGPLRPRTGYRGFCQGTLTLHTLLSDSPTCCEGLQLI